ncbi:MAG: response regulator [Planctomycetes bacterium]|nr:response regulator [Planctomycetota bacterium]
MLATRRVLIADDDLEVRSGIVDLLSPMGLEILQAESGLEVLDWLGRRARDPFDLLLLDMHMPGCSGLEVLTALRARHAAESRDDLHPIVPTIFCSGRAEPELERRALEMGAFSFLRKPVRPDHLRGEVLRALDAGRAA